MAGTVRGDLCTFMTICRRILPRIRNVLDKLYRENKTQLMSSKFPLENRGVYEILWKSMVGADRTI